MALCQTKIPFKSRKTNKAIRKSDIENSHGLQKAQIKRKRKITENVTENTEIGPACKAVKRYTDESVALKNNIDCPLPGREKELEWLNSFLFKHLECEEPASLYISGQPGTGKTACLLHLLQSSTFIGCHRQIFINCTMLKSANEIYTKICTELNLGSKKTSECLKSIKEYLCAKENPMTLLILDEVDQLDSKRQSVLQSVFGLSTLNGSRVIVIGVANTLHAAARALPRLKKQPHTLTFAPYTKEQIISILTFQGVDKQFSPVALQLLAGKIAATSGDMRQVQNMTRTVIDSVKHKTLVENKNLENTKESPVSVDVKTVLEVIKDNSDGPTMTDEEFDDVFPVQQKLILCSLVLLKMKSKNKEITLGRVYDVYKRMAAARHISALSVDEAGGACSQLAEAGWLRVAGPGAGAARSRRLHLRAAPAALAARMRRTPLLANLVDDDKLIVP